MQLQDELTAAELIFALAFYGILFVIWIGITFLVAWLMYRAAKSLPESYRSHVVPGQAFLIFIPIFGLIWVFIYTKNLSRAFQTFFRSQQIQTDDCGEQSGLFWGISSACSIIPCLGILAAIVSLVFMILYLVKVTECKNRVESLALEPQPQRKPITQYPNDQNDNPYAPH